MASKNLLEFEKAIEYMDPMQVNEYLQKTLDFLKRNNSEIFFPSITSYVEAFLVNLVIDTRNLKSKAFDYDNRMVAAEIIEVLEMSKEVFRWTHAYESGNLLVYKKIFSNKIKIKPIKLSAIADRMSQPHASDLRRPHTYPSTQVPKYGVFTTSYKLRFLDQTLRFVKSTETKLLYQEMPLSQAEYIYNLLKYKDKDVGLGFKSLYAQLWEAMEDCMDYDFEVTLNETGTDDAVLVQLDKVPKNSNKPREDKRSVKTKNIVSEKGKDESQKGQETERTRKENKDPNKETEQSLCNSFIDPNYADAATQWPSLALLANMTDAFFRNTVIAMTEFVGNEALKLKTFSQLSGDEMELLQEVISFAESKTIRDLLLPKYRILLWRLNLMVKEAFKKYHLASTVDEEERSITWRKIPKGLDADDNAEKKLFGSSVHSTYTTLPPLELLANISEPFFRHTVADLTDFADDESCASRTYANITRDQIVFVKRIRELAGSPKVREMFDPFYRDLLLTLNHSINEASANYKITTAVNEKDGSITLYKKPKFSTPAPLHPAGKANIRKGARSKSMVATKTRDRSISRDRLIQFEKGGIQCATNTIHPSTEPQGHTNKDPSAEPQGQERGRNMNKRTAKLLEDLSTPVESDVGMRMMLLMGWSGGALGARGDGIIEPLMPKIELPTRGGLGHVPPPKVVPRKPIDFRLMLLHNILDFLLHDEKHKEVQLKEPITKKEGKFVKYLLQSVNGRHNIQLTENENELLARIYGRLADYPTMEVRADTSEDLRTMSLHKVLDRPLRALNIKIPKPKATSKANKQPPAPKKGGTQPQPAPKAGGTQPEPAPRKLDVVISKSDVNLFVSQIDIAQFDLPPTQQAIKKRALRLLFLTKFANAWTSDCWEQMVFKYNEGGISKPTITFMSTVVVHLNNDDWCLTLYGAEKQVYGDLLTLARRSMLALEFKQPEKMIITRTSLIIEDSLPNNFAALKVGDDRTANTDNHNEIVNVNDSTKNNVSQKVTSAALNTASCVRNVYVKTVKEINDDCDINKELNEGNIFIEVIDNSSSVETIVDVDMDVNNNKDDCFTNKCYDNDVEEEAIIREDHGQNETADQSIRNHNKKDVNFGLKIADDRNLVQFTENEEDLLKNGTNPDGIVEFNNDNNDILKNIEDVQQQGTNFKVDKWDTVGLSDLDKDIQNLEMAILNSDNDVDCVVKTDLNSGCVSDLEMDLLDTDLTFDINQEHDDSNISGKRSHSNSICSQEFDPKKTKLNIENDENVVIIMPNNTDEKTTAEIIKEVQTAMVKELERSGSFLPLLKCHGAQNGGLVYSCHDEDDVAWLKKVISAANLDLEIVVRKDISLEKNSREMLILINSYIPLDTRKTFRKFEIYNVGLDTRLWKVSWKHTTDTFVMFIVTVDEKSFKYISDEKFTLYCGIDKAQFSIIFK